MTPSQKKEIEKRHRRIVVLNNDIYEMSEVNYQKLLTKLTKTIKVAFKEKEHKRKCRIIRKYGKIICETDWILRDD